MVFEEQEMMVLSLRQASLLYSADVINPNKE